MIDRDAIIADLLVRWEDSRRTEAALTAEALCADHPELIASVSTQLARLERMYQLLGGQGVLNEHTSDRPELSSEAVWPPLDGYECLGEIGRGGMGVVFRARQTRLRREVAIKVVRVDLDSDHLRVRFRSEAEAAAELDHPHLVSIHDVGQHAGQPYLVMEFVSGGNLKQFTGGAPQPPRAVAAFVAKLARAIAYAHAKGVVHRDIKPGNVLMQPAAQQQGETAARVGGSPDLTNYQPKIADFGVAKRLQGHTEMTTTGQWLGTPAYMAPEQFREQEAISPRTDIYALGVTLYELLVGRPPFVSPSPLQTARQVLDDEPLRPSRLQPGVAADLDTICLKCLDKQPLGRYASADQLADDLERFLAGEPVRARPISWVERVGRWTRRNPTTASLTAALLLAILVGVGAVLWKWQEAETARRRADANFERAWDAVEECLTVAGQGDALASLDHPAVKAVRTQLLDSATRFYDEFLEEFEQDPRLNAEKQLDIGRVLIRLAEINNALGNSEEATRRADRAAALLHHLMAQGETRQLKRSLSSVYYSLGRSSAARGELETAVHEYTQALAHLPSDSNDESSARQQAIYTRWARARALDDLARPAAALPDWQYAAQHAPVELRPHLQVDLGCCYARQGDHAAGYRIAADLAESETADVFVLGGCARLLSVCGEAAARDKANAPASQVAEYLGMAVDCLQRALDVSEDRRDELWAEVQRHEDFSFLRASGYLDELHDADPS